MWGAGGEGESMPWAELLLIEFRILPKIILLTTLSHSLTNTNMKKNYCLCFLVAFPPRIIIRTYLNFVLLLNNENEIELELRQCNWCSYERGKG